MKAHLAFRRVHTWLGLLLIMFFLKFAVSAIPFSHGRSFNEYYKDKPQWRQRYEREYSIELPKDSDLREIGGRILDELDMHGSYGAWRMGSDRISVNIFSFGNTARVIYNIKDGKVVVEDKVFRWDDFLRKFHWIGGYHQDRFIHDLFAFMIDLTCVAVIIWVMTGLAMWWRIPSARKWGIIALAGGWISFIIFLVTL